MVSLYGPHFEPPQLLTFDFYVDQDLAIDFDTDPEPAFHAIMQI